MTKLIVAFHNFAKAPENQRKEETLSQTYRYVGELYNSVGLCVKLSARFQCLSNWITVQEHVMSQVHTGREYPEQLSDHNLFKSPKSASNLYKS
jgi:hypothetical protein